MAHIIGPKCRLCRREGQKLFSKGARCFSDKCAVTKNNTPPGQNGQGFKKLSEYGRQLREKQKARRIFDIPERQMARYYDEANKQAGDSSNNLLKLLVMRMDSVVYRLGMIESPHQARQMVTHGAFLLNGRRVDIPSIQIKPGDKIELRPHSKNSKMFAELSKPKAKAPSWISFDSKSLQAEILDYPNEEQLKELNLNSQMIVEYYSR